ncbi:MAG: mechanosensitive ion channel family protein [Pseudomonadota bacterium]|jgi:small-conductance mechanosensitive channel|nr:mechanosensitive ion channel [Alphaproteobacteria bacterium]
MWKFVVFIGTFLCLFQNVVDAADISSVIKTPSIVAGPDYAKSKREHKLTTDADITGAVVAQKFISEYKVKDFSNLLKVENILSLGLLLGRLSIIVLIFTIVRRTINRFTTRFVGSIIKSSYTPQRQSEAQAVAKTAGPILNSVLHWILVSITLLIILAEIGVDIMPIVYSFGVLGLAISIGAQTLVKDIISGILTLLEGIVSVGEIVQINGNIGTIEAMSLRSIEFRHANGTMQVVSFSDINSLINLSRDYSICTIVVPVGHEANVEEVEKAYNDVFNDLKASKEWGSQIVSKLDLKGIASITETAIYFKACIQITPDPYDLFGQEFRKRLFMKMKEYKISAPKFANVMIEN